MKYLTLLFCFCIAGCASWPVSTRIEETTFLTLHAVDGYQTAQLGRFPGLYETESAWAIGRKPDSSSTAAYFAGIALLHYAVTDYMCKHNAPKWLITTWELGGIVWDVKDITQNYILEAPR